ncbi:hypothetical protein JAK58_07635 [Stenotrophomonas maltophilia]|uniref:hypothetical protein n=1 Tax=Stenotrophomonas maltophilia TaxID=40324 RepID=UPI0021C5C434|nr:hypothetical protein [Stenotrophomonas maltophilia]MCU1091389.1 hypothetical protein [Stenotrophomonas maltophilia]
MTAALIALMLLELLLLLFWAPIFFRTGIVLFNQRTASWCSTSAIASSGDAMSKLWNPFARGCAPIPATVR